MRSSAPPVFEILREILENCKSTSKTFINMFFVFFITSLTNFGSKFYCFWLFERCIYFFLVRIIDFAILFLYIFCIFFHEVFSMAIDFSKFFSFCFSAHFVGKVNIPFKKRGLSKLEVISIQELINSKFLMTCWNLIIQVR